jgi:hypothetical protein
LKDCWDDDDFTVTVDGTEVYRRSFGAHAENMGIDLFHSI